MSIASSVAQPPTHGLSSSEVTCRGTEVTIGMRTSLKCQCGQWIGRRDVMQKDYLKRELGPVFVYIKFRCTRCKKLGEHLVRREEWENALLQDANLEISTVERSRFEGLGAITLREMRQFHNELEALSALPAPHSEDVT